MTQDIAARFKRNTAEHAMTVLHDEGLYRHLRFQHQVWRPPLAKPQKSSIYWFDVITVPGALIFQGDGDSFVFRRIEDMFEFFRDSAWQGQPNLSYWAEKLTGSDVMKYDEGLLRKHVEAEVAEAVKENPALTGLTEEVRSDVLDELYGDESLDRTAVEEFKYWSTSSDRYKYPQPKPDFVFGEIWEVSFRDYDWWFVWACHAIVWGISQYDAFKAGKPLRGNAPAVVDVELPSAVA